MIKKEKDYVTLTNPKYDTPGTSLLVFHFEPQKGENAERQLAQAKIQIDSIDGKDVYSIDGYFSEKISDQMREISRNASFSRKSYGSLEGKEKGESPAQSMNNQEKWEFFAKPPQAIEELYGLFGLIGSKLDAKVSTLPWDLCDAKLCASAFATNRLERCSSESMNTGKHTDYDPVKGLPFAIPILSSEEKKYHPSNFINGEAGKPLLVSAMLYVTEDNFCPEFGLGTIFCENSGEVAKRLNCQHMRICIFEGDILHSIEKSNIPDNIHTWRISFVFKLMINPNRLNVDLKNKLREIL